MYKNILSIALLSGLIVGGSVYAAEKYEKDDVMTWSARGRQITEHAIATSFITWGARVYNVLPSPSVFGTNVVKALGTVPAVGGVLKSAATFTGSTLATGASSFVIPYAGALAFSGLALKVAYDTYINCQLVKVKADKGLQEAPKFNKQSAFLRSCIDNIFALKTALCNVVYAGAVLSILGLLANANSK